jgi:hypothetical protein
MLRQRSGSSSLLPLIGGTSAPRESAIKVLNATEGEGTTEEKEKRRESESTGKSRREECNGKERGGDETEREEDGQQEEEQE